MGEYSFEVSLCTVVHVVPQNGFALVIDGTGTVEELGELKVAYLPCSDIDKGASIISIPKPGDHIMCARDPFMPSRCFMLCQADLFDKDATTGCQGTRYYNTDRTGIAADSEAVYSVLESYMRMMSDRGLSVRPKGTGIEADMMPGDVSIGDADGAGLFVGRLLATLRGSPSAYIEASAIENCINGLAETVSVHTFGTEHVATHDLRIDNTAIAPGEVLGARAGLVSAVVDERYTAKNETGEASLLGVLKPVQDDTLPLYRLQHIEGGPVDGRESTVVGFPLDKDNDNAELELHTVDTEPPVLSRRRDSLSGELQDASVYGISLVKTPYVSAILQRGYGETVTEEFAEYDSEEPDLRRPWQRNVSTSDTTSDTDSASTDEHSDDDIATDAAINKLIDTMLSGDYVDRLLDGLAQRGLKVSTESASVLAGKDAVITQPGGASVEQNYPLPEKTTLTDPISGQVRTYYAASSFISQEPNGDILIADGYGSEIRMSRGNIYISPALDLICRPGRDMSVMAGRHQAYNSQDTCTINTAAGMYVKADKDLRLAGAMNEGKDACVVSLESQGANSAGGVTIRSKATTGIYGVNITVARCMEEDAVANTTNDTTGSVEKDDKTKYAGSYGSIVLDAGSSGSVLVNGSYASVTGDEIDLFTGVGDDTTVSSETVTDTQGTDATTVKTGKQSLLTLVPSGIIAAGNNCNMLCSQVLMGGWKGEATVAVARGYGKTKDISVGDAASADDAPCNLVVTGSAIINKVSQINKGLIVCNKVLAKSFGSINGTVGRVPEKYTTTVTDASGEHTVEHDVFAEKDMSYSTAFVLGSPTAQLSSYNNAWSYDWMRLHRFWFPDYGVDNGEVVPKMPGMRWQAWYKLDPERQNGSTGCKTWTEKAVQDESSEDTYPYPGNRMWTDGVVTYPEYKTEKIADGGYRINVPASTENK